MATGCRAGEAADQDLDLVNLDMETASIFSRERAWLERSGNIIPDFDILIASSALATTSPSSRTTAAIASASKG